MYQKIILAYDGSLESQQALVNCKDLSQWQHAKVHLLSVVPYLRGAFCFLLFAF